jgi:hypothetical protein
LTACGVVFLAISLADPGYLLLLAMVFLAECAATVAMPAARTMVGRTVPTDHLASANGMLLAAIAIGFAFGSALGSLIAGTFDYRWALAGNAVSFLISVLLMTLLPAATPEPRTKSSRGFCAETTLTGLSVLRTNPNVLPVFIGMVGVSFAAAMDRPALIVLVRENLNAAPVWYGLALGGVAIGALAASLGAMRYRGVNAKALAFFSAGIFAQAAGHLTMGLSSVVVVLVLGALVAGFGNGLESICGNTLLQGDARRFATPAPVPIICAEVGRQRQRPAPCPVRSRASGSETSPTPPIRGRLRRLRAGVGPRPPRHPDLPQQPRQRLPGGRGSGPGDPAARGRLRRLRAGVGPQPPPDDSDSCQLRCRQTQAVVDTTALLHQGPV